MKRAQQRGFTFIEIMLVLVILGILAAALLPNIVGADRPAMIVTTKANLETMRQTIQLFRAKEGRYPKDDLSDLLTETYTDMGKEKPYLKKFPAELITSPTGNNKVRNALDTSGGWYYDAKSAEIYINYNKDLGVEWDIQDGQEKNPSQW